MDPIVNMLYTIKSLPKYYIEKISITRLIAFISGYICCYNNLEGYENRIFDLPEFYRYAQSVYAIPDIPISQMFLEQNENDEEKAFDKFYELLDSFLNSDPEKYMHERCIIPSLHNDHKLSKLWREDLEKKEIIDISHTIKEKTKDLFDGDCICNEEYAAEIAKIIFKSAYGDKYNHNLPLVVKYDAKNEVWLIYSNIPSNEKESYFVILMRKKNAEIIAIWETTEQTE